MTTENIIKSLNLTDSAAHRIASVISSEKKSQFRVYVTGGGCSGFQDGFRLDESKEEDDTVLREKGVTVLIDALSMQYIYGSTLDYVENLEGSKFVINNPNATTTCGCGSSFSI